MVGRRQLTGYQTTQATAAWCRHPARALAYQAGGYAARNRVRCRQCGEEWLAADFVGRPRDKRRR